MKLSEHYGFRPNGCGAGKYVERVHQASGMSYAEILRRCVLCAEHVDLFQEAEGRGDDTDNPARAAAVDASNVDAANVANTNQSEGGIRAADLSSVETKPQRPRNDSAPQPRNKGVNRDEQGGFLESILQGW